MKIIKATVAFVLALLIVSTSLVPAQAALYAGEHMVLLANSIRGENGMADLLYNEKLSLVAKSYADILFENPAFCKTTDFKLLPNGERVISLTKEHNISVTGFYYSVFFGDINPTVTDEFKKSISDFAYMGVARMGDYIDGQPVEILVLVYAKTVVISAV